MEYHIAVELFKILLHILKKKLINLTSKILSEIIRTPKNMCDSIHIESKNKENWYMTLEINREFTFGVKEGVAIRRGYDKGGLLRC